MESFVPSNKVIGKTFPRSINVAWSISKVEELPKCQDSLGHMHLAACFPTKMTTADNIGRES